MSTPDSSSARREPAATEYPLSSPRYEACLYHGREIQQQLSQPPTECFSDVDDPRGISLRVFDIHRSPDDGVRCTAELCSSEPEVVEQLLTAGPPAARPRVRIISIHSKRTIQPLLISGPLMQRILAHYDVAPEFVPIIFSFGDDPDVSESSNSGSSNLYVQPGLEDGSKKLSYMIRYVEDNQRNSNPWSRRHTGVYHHHTADFDLIILLQCVANSTAERRLLDLTPPSPANHAELRRLACNPFRIHLLLASSYFLNWRWSLREMGSEFNEKNDWAMVLSRETLGTGSGPGGVSFELVRSLRNLHDKVLSTQASCKADLQVIKGLVALEDPLICELHGLSFQMKQLEGFIDGAEVLRGRIRNSIDLIGYTLDHHIQVETVQVYSELRELTQKVHDLTKKGVAESATVRIITLVSAFYLPGSFVATLYGMNFFVFDVQNSVIVIADDFWIFIATWVPLMLLTYGLYYLVARDEAQRRGHRLGWPWKARGKAVQSGRIMEK